LKRSELLQFFDRLAPCLVGVEACATAHYWARELSALGHQVRLVPPSYVKAYLKRGKNDAADAEAICEAVTRPNMRFVPVKSEEQQGVLVLHRARELLVRQRTMLVNGLRGHIAEFGIIAPQGIQRLPELVAELEDETTSIPQIAR
jgi:transposase